MLYVMKLTLAVKLAPDATQYGALLATMERFNAACDWIAECAFRERTADKYRLQQTLYHEVRERFGLSAQMAIRAIAKVAEAYKRDRSIQPRFRSHGALPYDQRIMSWRGVERVSLLTLSGRQIIPVRFGQYQAVRMDRVRGQADLIFRGGVFHLYCTLEVPEVPMGHVEDFLRIDLGIVNLAVDSDGTVHSGAAIGRRRRIHAHRRRNLQRKGTHSAHRKLRRIGHRQSRYQRNTNHVISKQVVAMAQGTDRGIALEGLLGIRQRIGSVRRKQRARHSNWAFGHLRQCIAYKAQHSGIPVVLVDPRNTSRTCAACGYCDKANRRSQADFLCGSCGHAAPADHNAALNIRARAVVMRPMVPDASQCAA
jgi:putative transposase